MNRTLARFGRGKDRLPRKRRLKQKLLQAGEISGNTVMQGLTGAGLLGTAGLLASPSNAVLQGKLARAGLALGTGYGIYEGVKTLRQKKKQ